MADALRVRPRVSLAGARSEGELIRLQLTLLASAWRLTPDAKALCALTLYRELQADGTLPPMKRGEVRSPTISGVKEDASSRARRASVELEPLDRAAAAADGGAGGGVRAADCEGDVSVTTPQSRGGSSVTGV